MGERRQKIEEGGGGNRERRFRRGIDRPASATCSVAAQPPSWDLECPPSPRSPLAPAD